MANLHNRKPHERQSLIVGQAQKKLKDVDHEHGLVFSFKHLDRNQGQSFEDWEANGLLSDMLNTFMGFCQRDNHLQCRGKSFTVYGAFPSKSEFTHPPHVPEDAQWARIHIKGKPCIGGHVFRNIFYVVFLDRYHQFWKTDLQEH